MTRSAIVVGAGFGGLAAAIALRKEGVAVTVLERASRVGGVWHQNTYPGAACDVPSTLYSYSFAPNPGWDRRFAAGPQIQRYLEEVARDHGLVPHLRLGVEVTAARFDEAEGEWEVTTSDGPLRADLLVPACGQLHRPAVPPIADLEQFAGPAFHSSRWPDGFDPTGLRIGVVGTGASAIQIVPAIAGTAARVTVFQRTAPWILPKFDRVYGRRTKAAFARIPGFQRAGRLAWWSFLEAAIAGFVGRPRVLAPLAAASRANLRRQVPDPALRDALTPRFDIGCKRILLSSEWYPALMRDDVDLRTAPIARAVADGLMLDDGEHVALDAIVFGTGFHAREFVAPMAVTGRGGQTLERTWDGLPHAWHGLSVPGFPNLFLMYGPNTFGGSGSAIYMIESQARHVGAAARALAAAAATTIEVRPEAHAAFLRELRARQQATIWATGGCSSWYLDDQGRDPTNWPGYTVDYRRRTQRVDPATYDLGRT